MAYFDLKISDYSSIQDAMNAIPAGVTYVDLAWNDLGRLSGAELAVVFASIPTSVAHLGLKDNFLGRLSGAELGAVFARIPESVKYLDLSHNDLWKLSGVDLAAVFASIPVSVTDLDLGGNYLGRLSGAALEAVLSSIRGSVTHLDLRDNELGRLSGAGLVAAFASIPRSVTHLDLGVNCLGRLSKDDLAAVMQAIPNSVTSLDLGFNMLGQLSKDDLAAVMQAIPNSVTSLNLLDDETVSNWVNPKVNEMGIKPNVTRIDLFCGSLDTESQRAFYSKLPITVKSLDLSKRFSQINLNKNVNFFNALWIKYQLWYLSGLIPKTIKEVVLPGILLAPENRPYLATIFSGFHRSGMTISFEGEQIFTPGDREANDALLKYLRSAADGRSVCLTNTGESNLERALSTLFALSLQVVDTGSGCRPMPLNVIHCIASFLAPPDQAQDVARIFDSKGWTTVQQQILEGGRKSENLNKKAGGKTSNKPKTSIVSRFYSMFARENKASENKPHNRRRLGR